MISEREDYEFKDGGRLTLVNGEDGVTVNIDLGKPNAATYTDMKKLTKFIGRYIAKNRPQVLWEDGFGSKVAEQDRELNKIAIRLRRINPQFTRIDYKVWLHGAE